MVPIVTPALFEGLFIKMTLHENKQIIIGNIYRPPTSMKVESIKNILSTVSSLVSNKEMILLGDFNINWLHSSTFTVKNMINSLNLTQLIAEPTRLTSTSKSLLDWALVSHPERIIKSGVLPDNFSDHHMIYCIWKISIQRLPPKFIKIRQTKFFNRDQFINDLHQINWYRLNLIPFIDDAWHFVYTELLNVINKHAPWTTVKVKGSHLPWVNGDLINLFKQRDRAWHKFRRTKHTADWEEYKRLRNNCTMQTRNSKSSYFRNCLSNDFKNPQRFWKQVNNVLGKSGRTTTTLNLNDERIDDPVSIANAFSLHFSSAPQVQSHTFKPDLAPCSLTGSSFSFAEISPADVQKAISELSSTSGAGLDGIENKFIKMGSHVLAAPLALLFNLSFSSSTVPLAWKCAKVIPLHKGGESDNINNYRPISIINSVVKVFEKIIFTQLSNYLANNDLLSQCQSGFRKHFSTTTALLKFTNDVFLSFDNRMCTGALFLDLTKAFDLVDHYLLLDKLYSFGLSTSSLLWFNSYLHNRRQCVSFGGSLSQFTVIDRGIPQGSSLGPLLFSIFINDLPRSCTGCNIQLYADDTVIYCSNE